MRVDNGSLAPALGCWRLGALSTSIEMSDDGLILGAGSRLIRMSGGASSRLAIEADRDRALALLAIAFRRPVGADLLVRAEAAATDWRRGDKALANLRLVFAGLPRLADPEDAARLRLAEYCLDEGLSPHVLLKELGLDPTACGLAKYNRDELRDWRGRWSDGTGFIAPAFVPSDEPTIVVAIDDRVPDSKKPFKDPIPGDLPEAGDENPHAIDINPLLSTTPGPGPGGGRGTLPFEAEPPPRRATSTVDVAAIAKDAAAAVGPGRGPVYGTAVHTEFRLRAKAIDPDAIVEQSYLNGEPAKYGTKGSIRIDHGVGTLKDLTVIHELKTGDAVFSSRQEQRIRAHIPPQSRDVEIKVVRP